MTRSTDPASLDIVTAATEMRAGSLRASALLASILERIDEVEPELRAFVLVDREGAQRAAVDLDRELARDKLRGPLHGIPVAVKDIFDVAGFPTRCGCRAYDDAPLASEDSTVVARLRAAGAIILGKTTTHELACGVYTPPTRNPWDLERIPGGSSGGSGAAIAAGMAMGATGSDTGGSIRIPAALCGVVGIKPTYGRVSRAGVAALSWSLDHAGPLARTVDDAALLLQAMAGVDPRDPTSIDRPLPDLFPSSEGSLQGRRIGVPSELFFNGITDAVRGAVDDARRSLSDLAATIVEVSIPELAWTLPAEFGIVLAEAASYHEQLLRTRPKLIGENVLGLLDAGALLPATYYLRAQRLRAVIQTAVRRAFEQARLDALLAPTLPAAAARHDQLTYLFDGREEGVTDAYVRTTAPFNLTGQPVVAVPAGLSPEGLPIGVQFAGRPYAEDTVVTIARAYERASGWRKKAFPPRGIAGALAAARPGSGKTG